MGQDLQWQNGFFDRLKEKVPSNVSVADEIADLLGISNDSAYRRMRGETALSLDESIKLSGHFSISMEDLFGSSSDSVLFHHMSMTDKSVDMDVFLKKTLDIFQQFPKLKNPKGVYAAKNIPIFYYFYYPQLAKFKLFFWLKTVKEGGSFSGKNFSPDLIPESFFEAPAQIAKIYSSLPFVEIWNEETVNSILLQIDYYAENGFFSSKADGMLICDQFEQMMQMIKIQCETGVKWHNGKPVSPEVPYYLYFNEILILEEIISLTADDFNFSLITYHAMDYLYTYQKKFSDQVAAGLKIQMKKSIPISGTGEKERNRFFNKIFEKIEKAKEKFR